MKRRRVVLSICLVALVLAVPIAAQQPPPAAPTPAAPAAAAPAPAAAPPQPAAFTYDHEGRRDPFVSLVGRGAAPRSLANRPPGVAGLLIDEVVIKGIVKGQGGFFALVHGADNRVHTLRAGDRLMDGTVKAVTAAEIVFSQDVNDPLLVQKQREIRKSLRPGEESRG